MTDYLMAKWYWLVDELSEAAAARTPIDIQVDRTILVSSASLNAFVNHYIQADIGTTYICYGQTGAGKTMAAVHLLRGQLVDRPKRALMINAAGSEDFARSFAQQRSAADAAPHMVNILCSALVFEEKKASSTRPLLAPIWDLFYKVRFGRLKECLTQRLAPIEVRIKQGENLQIGAGRPRSSGSELPLLVIDDLAESASNLEFVHRLYTRASGVGISVLILTKDMTWATKMAKLNDGVKILPMDNVIRNPQGDSVDPFTDDPEWTGMGWALQDLQSFAATLGPPDVSAELREGMTPAAVLRLHGRRNFEK